MKKIIYAILILIALFTAPMISAIIVGVINGELGILPQIGGIIVLLIGVYYAFLRKIIYKKKI